MGALQGLAPDQVFLVGTASKALAPAVRLGWVHAPSPLAGAVAERPGTGRYSPVGRRLAVPASAGSWRPC